MNCQLFHRDQSLVSLILLVILLACICRTETSYADSSANHLRIMLDATEISRNLIHSTITMEAGSDTLTLLYPKWLPGMHGPCGPIENLAGFKAFDGSGTRLLWERDYTDPFRFYVFGSGDKSPVTISISYICSQPTDLSWGSDSESTPTLAVINWNTVSVYPEGSVSRDLTVEPRLIIPDGWSYATGMPFKERRGDTLVFDIVSYEELIDFPIICGAYLNTYKIATTASAEYFVHVAVDEDILLPLADSAFADWSRLVYETEALFGRSHFDNYNFLVLVSDSVEHYGLEHRNSSVNSVDVMALKEYGKTSYFLQGLLPHEFVHTWCGKYRRPVGMNTPDFQTPMNMELLWVYEGLTEYLGMMLAARSGLMSADYFKQDWAFYWGDLRHTAGRQWRPLRDVAVTTYTIWGGSESWSFHRRGADYYSEGALLWLEVDSRIRELSSGKRSLDDFCRSFFGTGDRDAHSISFEKRDMVAALTELADFAWDSLFTERISRTREKLDESPLAAAGYKFAYTTEKPKALSDTESRRECRYFYESVGFAVADEDNRILQVVPGSPADIAGLYTGMNILGVNAKTYSLDRLEKAIRDAVKIGKIILLVQRGESLNQVTLQYQGGLRYLNIVPDGKQRQWLDEIIKPRSSR